jgi:hypothetical protein
MKDFIFSIADALFTFTIAVLLIACPQVFTRADLTSEENAKHARRLKKAGWWLLLAGILILAAGLCRR